MSNPSRGQNSSGIANASYVHQSPGYLSQTLPNPFGVVNGGVQSDFVELQHAYFEALRAQQKQQYELSLSNGMNLGFHLHNSFGLVAPYGGPPMVNSAISAYARSKSFHNEQQLHSPLVRTSISGHTGTWHSDKATSPNSRIASSLLEEFKNNKARVFELSDIFGHVVEFR